MTTRRNDGGRRVRRGAVATAIVVAIAAAVGLPRLISAEAPPGTLPRIAVDGSDLVVEETGEPFFVLGLNYLGDGGRLIGEMWDDDWEEILSDLADIRDLGVNSVHLHPQIADFMSGPGEFDTESFDRLVALVDHADSIGLYVGIVGLGVYRNGAEPAWLDALDEPGRWAAMADFWRETARRLADRPGVLFYNLMNAPRVPDQPQSEWYLGDMAGLSFHQWLALDRAGRPPDVVGAQWTAQMVAAIREYDPVRPLALGTACRPDCPYSMTTSAVQDQLDITSPHVYPVAGDVPEWIALTNRFAIGKPLVVSETFPLTVGWPEWEWWLLHEKPVVAGYVGQYDGRSIAELEALGGWNPWLDSARTWQRLGPYLLASAPTSEPLHHYENPDTGVHAYSRIRDDVAQSSQGFEHRGPDGHLLSFNPGDGAAICEFVDGEGDREYVLGCTAPTDAVFHRATGWAYPTESAGTVAWHEYWNPDTDRHRYTVHRDDGALSALGFVHQGVEAWIPAEPTSAGPECTEAVSHPFTDVAPTSFAHDDIGCLFALGITTGTSPTTFDPAGTVTREQMAAFLARLYRRATGGDCGGEPHPFDDVDPASFAAADVGCVYSLGVTTGTSSTTYSPTAPVSREQMAAFLARLYRAVSGLPCDEAPDPFDDVDPDSFALLDIGCLRSLAVTTGTSPTTFSPDVVTTREQTAAFLARLHRVLIG